MNAKTKIYFAITLILEVAYVAFSVFLSAGAITISIHNFIVSFFDFLLNSVLWLIISIVSLKRAGKGKKKVISISILMKMAVLLFCFGWGYIAFEDGIYALVTFCSTAIPPALIAIIMAKVRQKNEEAKLAENGFSGYNAGDYWLFTASEYLRLNFRDVSDMALRVGTLFKPETVKGYNKLKFVGLTDSDKENISKYSGNPIIYFLQWLLENNHMSESFCANHSQEKIEKVKNETISVNEFFADEMDYMVKTTDIKPELKEFINEYYEPFLKQGCFTHTNGTYFFDYASIIDDYSDYFYCHNYSYDVYRKMRKIFDKRYNDYMEQPSDDDYKLQQSAVHWDLFNADLDVYTNCDTSQIMKCEEALNNLDEKQLKKLERMAKKELASDNNYNFQNDFKPKTIFVYMPKDNDVYFRIEDESEFAFAVRNGIVMSQNYSPYSQRENEQYILENNDIDFLSLTTQESVEELCKKGKLKAVSLEMNNMELKNSDNKLEKKIYITAEAEPIFRENMDKIATMGNYGMLSDVKIGTLSHENCIVPQALRFIGISNINGKKSYRYLDELIIWN